MRGRKRRPMLRLQLAVTGGLSGAIRGCTEEDGSRQCARPDITAPIFVARDERISRMSPGRARSITVLVPEAATSPRAQRGGRRAQPGQPQLVYVVPALRRDAGGLRLIRPILRARAIVSG